ncbi:serine/threonine-protein phosphatase, partial [candidate division KSB1 bacterium]|nr:serine/threonine-protein phosphatase [candidate division KSB1 bacterium]
GLPAAMLMAQIHAMLKSKVQNGIPLRQIMRETNAYVRTYTLRNKFVSLFFAVYNTDSRQLEYASAGHPFPFLVHKNGKHDFLYFSDAALGLSEDSDYEMHQTAVHPGDILCIYSDGLTEGMDGDHRPFGEERLLTIASAHRNKQPEQILTALRKDFMQFTRNGNHLDDRTILLIKFRK